MDSKVPFRYPCAARGYLIKERIGSGSFGRVYRAAVFKISWNDFVHAARAKLICPTIVQILSENGYRDQPNLLLEITVGEIMRMLGENVKHKTSVASDVIAAIDSCKIETKKEVAIKILDEDENEWRHVQREISIMHNLRHRNIVRVYRAFLKCGAMDQIWIIMPLLEIGSLRRLIRTKIQFCNGIKDPKLLASILKQVLAAMVYLHEDGRVHRDLKAANIMLSEDGIIKVGDFGFTADRTDSLRSFVGTASFMAPEIIERKRYWTKVDIWSFGITALELAYGRAPYEHLKLQECLSATLTRPSPSVKSYSKYHKAMPASFVSLVEKCLHKDPMQRPTARQLLSHRFFWNDYGSRYIRKNLIKRIIDRRKISSDSSGGAISSSSSPKKAAKPNKDIEALGSAYHDYWMIPVDSFVFPTPRGQRPAKKLVFEDRTDVSDDSFVFPTPRGQQPTKKLVFADRTDETQSKSLEAKKRWKNFMAYLRRVEAVWF